MSRIAFTTVKWARCLPSALSLITPCGTPAAARFGSEGLQQRAGTELGQTAIECRSRLRMTRKDQRTG